MKPRIIFIAVLLVVLPTAVLTIIAARSLRNRELVLQHRRREAAEDAVTTAANRARGRLEDTLEQVKSGMLDAVARGARPEIVEQTAARIRDSRDIVGEIYVFMNPWGFVVPRMTDAEDQLRRKTLEKFFYGTASEAPAETTREDPDEAALRRIAAREELVAALRKEAASARLPNEHIWLVLGDASYCFTLFMKDRRDLFVGYRIESNEFLSQLTSILHGSAGGGLALRAEGPGIEQAHTLTITDPFDSQSTVDNQQSAISSVLAFGYLHPPFDFVTLHACVADPERERRTEALRSKLFGWSIVLMAAGILAGAGAVIASAASEIRKARSRSDFVVGVSHDLRTPISSMRMLAESLYLGHVPEAEKKKQFLGIIVRESGRLANLIERVLFLVRFGQDALVYHLQTEDPGELARQATDAFRTATSRVSSNGDDEDLRLASQVAEALPAIRADRSAIVQVLLNLLDNADKYSRCQVSRLRPIRQAQGYGGQAGVRKEENREADIAIELRVDTVSRKRKPWTRARTWVRFAVQDRGPGIPRRQLRKVFKRYYRAPGAEEANVSGVGLGLALCRHVVESHGGWIEADSTPGQGSTFSFYLPATDAP